MIHESTTTSLGDDPRTSSEIRSEIRRTRGRMDETLDELGERMTLRSIVNTALDWYENRDTSGSAGMNISTGAAGDKVKKAASAAGKKTARTLSNTMREHPMPSALVGAGLAWMIVEALSDDDDTIYVDEVEREYEPVGYGSTAHGVTSGYDYDQSSNEPGMLDKAREKAEHAKDAVTGAVGTAKDKLGDARFAAQRARMRARDGARSAYGRTRDMRHDVSERVHHGYETGMARFERASNESPLALGLGFAALGALVGLLLPRTRREDDFIGEASDDFIQTVKEKGQDMMERGKEVGTRVAETAMQEADRQGLSAETLGQKASELASKVGEVVKKTKDEAKSAAEDKGLTGQQLKSEVSSSTQTMKEGNPQTFQQKF